MTQPESYSHVVADYDYLGLFGLCHIDELKDCHTVGDTLDAAVELDTPAQVVALLADLARRDGHHANADALESQIVFGDRGGRRLYGMLESRGEGNQPFIWFWPKSDTYVGFCIALFNAVFSTPASTVLNAFGIEEGSDRWLEFEG